MSKKSTLISVILITLILFLGWRFVRPMNIFSVSPAFERPVSTDRIPAILNSLHAQECANCHREFYDEWRTTIHSQAWTDAYFQADWRFDDEQQICKNCHTPLDKQQEYRVLGFNDREKWDPILAPNPDYDAKLQQEGVTCAACHLRDGLILGTYGLESTPHPVRKLDNPNRVCVGCHVVSGKAWDTFFRFPPCGTVAEIQTSQGMKSATDEDNMTTEAVAALGCVGCHMPLVERPIVPGGQIRSARRHLWRGGHDPDMVKSGLDISFEETPTDSKKRRFVLTLINVGAGHYLPTGTPDRHLTVKLRLGNLSGKILEEKNYTLKRTVMWRPFIIDLWDSRLPYNEPRSYSLTYSPDEYEGSLWVEAEVRYHLLDEKRRQRIGYQNKTPIAYDVFRQRLSVTKEKP